MAQHVKLLTAVRTAALCCMLFAASAGAAQSRYGTDSISCIKNLSLYSEYYKQNSFSYALQPWRWVFANCPQSSKNVFIHGARMYKDLIEKETVPAAKERYIDTLLMVYDKRIELYGEEGKVLGSKGIDMLRYRQANYEPAYEVLKKSIGIEQSASTATAVSSYFQSVLFMFNAGKLTKEQAVEEYSLLLAIIEANLANTPDDKYFLSAKDVVNRLLFEYVKPDCALMESLFSPQYDKNPTDTILLRKIVAAMDSKCSDADLYINAAVGLANSAKSASAYGGIARMYYKKGNKDKAGEYYDKAIDAADDNVLKSRLLYEYAVVVAANLSRSVALCKQAISVNPGNGAAYLLLARHYASGSKSCAEGSEQPAFVAKSVYWAAVDLCQKARSADPTVADEAAVLIDSYSANFPSIDEVFFQGLKVGDAYAINCWFAAATTVRVRK